MKECTLICNLHSGKGIKGKSIKKIIKILENYGYHTILHITKDEVVEAVTKKNYTKTIIIIVSCLLLVFASITLYFLIKKQKKLDSEEDSVNEEVKLENNNDEINKESD